MTIKEIRPQDANYYLYVSHVYWCHVPGARFIVRTWRKLKEPRMRICDGDW